MPPGRDRGAARGGDPRGRARALPGGDPHDRRGAGLGSTPSDPRVGRRSMSEARRRHPSARPPSDGAIRVRRALISVSDKTGVADFAKGLAGARGRDPLHRRHRGGAARGRARGDRRLRVHRPGGDPRRPGQDAAPAAARGAAGAARRPRAHGDAGARGDRADRPGLRQPLPVRADRRRPRGRATRWRSRTSTSAGRR